MCVQILQQPALAGWAAAAFPDIRMSLSVCLDTVATWITRIGQRRALRNLADEGRLLRDVGLNRQQALHEAGKPFWRR